MKLLKTPRYPIPADILSATIEAMRELESRYQAEAAALARLDSQEAKELAQERVEDANVATGLFDFYTDL